MLTRIFDSDSDELTNYLTKNKVGTTIVDNKKTWTIKEVEIDDTIPSHPETGNSSTKVILTLK